MSELKKILLKKSQESQKIARNIYLDDIFQNMMPVYEKRIRSIPQDVQKKFEKRAKKLTIDVDDAWADFYRDFNEVIICTYIKREFGIEMKKIKEGSSSSPDFEIGKGKNKFYGELKSLDFSTGLINQKKTQEKFLESNIEIERQQKKGQKISFAEMSIDPWDNGQPNYKACSVKYTIEELHKKILNNYKASQFKKGDTIFFISMNLLPLNHKFEDAVYPIFVSKIVKCLVSGILWNVAFGKKGDYIYNEIEFTGKPNIEGFLETNGFLLEKTDADLDNIKALVFCNARDGKIDFYSLYRKEEKKAYIKFLDKISTRKNDMYNTFFFERK